jgi:hypothetical protein
MSLCLSFLAVSREIARRNGTPTDAGCAVLGDGFIGYTVERSDGKQIYVGRACCKYCARVEAISQMAACTCDADAANRAIGNHFGDCPLR